MKRMSKILMPLILILALTVTEMCIRDRMRHLQRKI